jgi:hypothetical protein
MEAFVLPDEVKIAEAARQALGTAPVTA